MANKHHAVKTKAANGVMCDSKKEARRYNELMAMESAGIISDLQHQVRFELIPAVREPDRRGVRGGKIKGRTIERAVYYVADFTYVKDGKRIVEDVKGASTKRLRDFVIKRKLLLWRYGIRVVMT